MSGRLSGKVAVITAAGQGIGRATALAFADEGEINPQDVGRALETLADRPGHTGAA